MVSADRHGSVSSFDVSKGLSEGALVVASDISVVPRCLSEGAGGFFQAGCFFYFTLSAALSLTSRQV